MENFPNVLCPSHPAAPDLVISLVTQVMELHPDSNYLHIGADEVWQMGKCSKCESEVKARGWNPDEIFLFWVRRIASLIKEKYPQITLIIWDDMLRNLSASKLVEYDMGKFVEPMVWKYEPTNFNLPPNMFETYSQVFDCLWGASCFKGATGSTQFLPPIQHHIDNQLTWVSLLNEQQSKFKEVRGIVLTGWQRYDHYAVLCELLPVALPSLALCLKVLKVGSFTQEDHEAVSQELGFKTRVNVFPFPRPQILETRMPSPGHRDLRIHPDVVQLRPQVPDHLQFRRNARLVQ
ncbi:UNVERIFIED_CONTAM: hypothetical protein GTU68_020235 [Idotea baltica]|nr:hypothetical protein [Idotea baltica]